MDYLLDDLPIVISIKSVSYQKAKKEDAEQQEKDKLLLMNGMAEHFIQTHAADVPVDNYPLCFQYYLQGVRDLIVKKAIKSSLRITVECSTLEILECLWEDYRSGHFNAVAEERLLTDDIKKRFDVESVKLQTTILEEDYLACKLSLMGFSSEYTNYSLKPWVI